MELNFVSCMFSLGVLASLLVKGRYIPFISNQNMWYTINYRIFWHHSLTVGGGERFSSKMHVLYLNREERKIRQVRRPPHLFRPQLTINLNEIGMKYYLNPNEGKIHV